MTTTSGSPSPRAAGGPADSWYRGDCHVHSACSNGGELTPGQLARDARAAGLDFVAATEHNSVATHGEWRALARDDFLVVPGEEVTTADGHWLALGLSPGQLIDGNRGAGDGRLEACLDEVHEAGGLCVAAHPHAPYPTGEFRHPLQGFDAVEVWNGRWTSDLPWNADNETALADWHRSLTESIRADGAWRPAVGNSDTHLEGQIAVPHTVVQAPELTTAAVLAGIRAGRSWIAGSSTVDLSFTAYAGERDAGPGDRLATLGAPATVRVRVGGVPSGTVSFHTDHGRVQEAPPLPPDARGSGSAEWRTTAADSAFVRVEVRHPDGHMAALTNPVVLA